MQCVETFATTYFEGSDVECKEFSPEWAKELSDGIMQLKGNKIPNGLVSLECLFDRHDAYKKRKDEQIPAVQDVGGYERIKFGTEDDPKYINLGKCCMPVEKERFTSLLLEFKDVFAWCYDNLKNFRDGKFQHHIPLKPGVSPFQQKLINFNPKVAESIFQEVDKMLKARIIYPIHHSTWIANIVPIHKKNGKIRICVDFRNLNQANLNDNYPLPSMDHILQTVSG